MQDELDRTDTPRVSVRELIADILSLASEHAGFLALVVAAIVVGYSTLDMISEAGGIGFTLVVTIFVQYHVTEQLLKDRMAGAEEGFRRYGALLGASLISGMAIGVGAIAFIVPGVILIAGWAAATPFIVVEGRGPIEALIASWRATRASCV